MNELKLNHAAPRMLIADDDLCVVKLIAEQCTRMGFQVETATTGLQAISKAHQFEPDIVVVDIHMPDMDGVSVYLHLREIATKPLKVIAVTGHASAEVSEWCSGNDARYINKGAGFWNEFGIALSEICSGSAINLITPANAEIRKRPRVLLIDDDMSVSKFIASRLDMLGVDPLFASDANTGFFKAQREQPSVIISDYVMPNGDAEYLLSKLRNAPSTRHVPVIVYTSHALDGPIAMRLQQVTAGQPGAVRIVRKSLHAQELIDALKSFCGFVTEAVPPLVRAMRPITP